LIEAVKALKSNNPDITLRANSSSVHLQELLALEVLGVDYVAPVKPEKTKAPKKEKAPKLPKTPKAAKVAEVLELPVGLTWETVKGMKYRELQGICKALRSQGKFEGNIGGKGASSEALLSKVAEYFRGQGADIVEVQVSKSQTPVKDVKLSNWDAYRLEKLATDAINAAKVAVAA